MKRHALRTRPPRWKVIKYIFLTTLGAGLYFLCRASGQAHGGGEVLLLGLPAWYWVVAAVVRPIAADLRAFIKGEETL